MSVYIDDMDAPYRGMLMSHMVADTREELLSMAARIGVNHKWLQNKGTYREHFDICKAKKNLALRNGALPVSRRELGKIIAAKRKAESTKKRQRATAEHV